MELCGCAKGSRRHPLSRLKSWQSARQRPRLPRRQHSHGRVDTTLGGRCIGRPCPHRLGLDGGWRRSSGRHVHSILCVTVRRSNASELRSALPRCLRWSHRPEVRGPVAAGLWRPWVILPEGLAESLASDSLRDVLVHECAHVVRLDAWVGLLQRLAGTLFWPHPLVHYASGQLTRAREEVCDNHVLRCGSPRGYARTLLALTEQCLPLGAVRPGLGLLGSPMDAGRPRRRAPRHQENFHDTHHVSHEDCCVGRCSPSRR